MKVGKRERRPVSFGKIAIVVIVLVVIALAAGLFIREHRESVEKLLDHAYSMDAFIYQGETYRLDATVKNNTKALRVLRPMSTPDEYRFLPGENALWADAIDRFVYMDGSKLKTCDINGDNKEMVFQVSGFRYIALVRKVVDNYVIVERTYRTGSGGYDFEGDFFLVNLVTGDAVELRTDALRNMQYFSIADEYFYYGTSDLGVSGVDAKNSDRYRDICRFDLKTGENVVLTDRIVPENSGIFDDGQGLVDCGCVIDGYLYFVYDPKDTPVMRIPVGGGAVEKTNADIGQFGAGGISRITGYGDKVLIVCEGREDGGEGFIKALVFDPAEDEMSELCRWTTDSASIESLRVQDDALVVCCWDGAVLQEKLA